ncbi:hypothetical protein BD779DRAFT_1456037 [Infundibulicybe gibba]|nr:hypothetical protein BD779DRAFT_1456037 [Infundibulicybe gibba]
MPTLEEVDDIDAPPKLQRYIEPFPRPVATPVRTSKEKTKFEILLENQIRNGTDQWAPFANQEEWELAVWLMKNVGQTSTDEFLKLPATRDRMNLSFHNNRSFLKRVDALPTGPNWECEIVTAPGDQCGEDGEIVGEDMELWYRDPVECIKELLSNPAFKDSISYVPERVYTSSDGDDRIYDEMWTGDWWWDTQTKLPDGAAIAPLILASDKTQLSQFQGDKKAWPVYLTLGNISKEIRRRPSVHATVLLGYLPVPKLQCYSDATRSLAGYRLFHHCMGKILASLVEAGKTGVEMVCADGFVRLIYPILAAYVADYPEQCLVSCCMENCCPRCTVDPNNHGNSTPSPDRDVPSTLETLYAQEHGCEPEKFTRDGIRAIYKPFWRNLPHCNIFGCFTPDLLHQLHKGFFKDHIVKWCTSLVGEDELDARFKAMSGYPGLRHFSKGISSISQWTGTEHREMQRVFLGVIAGSVDQDVLTVMRAALDFIYYAQLQMQTSTTLAALKTCLATFHRFKDIFIKYEIRKHFNIPKIHSLLHYFASIQALGSNDGYNSESPERLHIDFAKDAFRASNKKDYHEQMALWLQRREAMWQCEAYIAWLNPQQQAADEHELSNINDPDNLNDLDTNDQANPHDASGVDPTSYRIAKTPPLRGVTVQHLFEHFGATNFIPALTSFLQQQQSHPLLPNTSDRFDLYKQIIITLPPNTFLNSQKISNRIRTSPAVPPRGRKKGSPGVFDTALIIDDPMEYRSRSGLAGLRVAQVRAIFLLPSYFGTHPHPLAYVEWFTSLGAPDPQTGMYVINRSTRQHRPNGTVISTARIVRGCHLMGQFGNTIAKGWTTDNILDKAKNFYLNPYIHVDTFTTANIN